MCCGADSARELVAAVHACVAICKLPQLFQQLLCVRSVLGGSRRACRQSDHEAGPCAGFPCALYPWFPATITTMRGTRTVCLSMCPAGSCVHRALCVNVVGASLCAELLRFIKPVRVCSCIAIHVSELTAGRSGDAGFARTYCRTGSARSPHQTSSPAAQR